LVRVTKTLNKGNLETSSHISRKQLNTQFKEVVSNIEIQNLRQLL